MLCHVSGWPMSEVMALAVDELQAWCADSVALWNRLQAASE
jgi:hypothetical protein